jgi:chromosome segregation ATPase
MSELERYKVYLPEAEGLLQEVNNRHQGALEEIEQQQKIAAEYEKEILDLNKNLKNLKKALQDQKQLYEVRVQSQE